MSALVLDAGALVALERNDRSVWGALLLAASKHKDVLVPSTALAQVWWRASTQVGLARALRHCVVAGFDPLALRVGELCGRTGTVDICDAHVALVAATRGDVLYTSDVSDMRRLLTACTKRLPAVVRC